MKNTTIIFFLLFSIITKSQVREFLIDTVIIKSYKQESILSTIENAKNNFKKRNNDSKKYKISFNLDVDTENVSKYSDAKFSIREFKKKKELIFVKDDFFKKLSSFELDPSLFFDSRLRYITNFLNLKYIKNPNLFKLKMREVDDFLQITCYSKSSNLKAVVLIDKKSFSPKAIYQTNETLKTGIKQTIGKTSKNKGSEVSYDLQDDNFTLLYNFKGEKVYIETLESSIMLNNYQIENHTANYNKKFNKVISKINMVKND